MEAIMRVLSAFWLAAISAFVAQPSAASAQPQPAQNTTCREFTTSVTIAGEQHQAVGQACQQPDGSWQIVQETPPTGQPPPEAVYPAPYPEPSYPAPYYPYWDYPYWGGPYWAGPPFFVADSFVFVDRFGHFRQFDPGSDRGGFAPRGFVPTGHAMNGHVMNGHR